MSTIADRIRKARAQSQLSQLALAARLGVHRSAVAQWEQADGTTPSLANLQALATELRVSFEWLATGRGPVRPAADPTPAVVLDEYAKDLLESRLLVAFRAIAPRGREAVVRMLEALGRRP